MTLEITEPNPGGVWYSNGQGHIGARHGTLEVGLLPGRNTDIFLAFVCG